MRRAICVLLMCVSGIAVGCGSEGSPAEGTPTVGATDSTTQTKETDTPALVGRWERVNECPQLVAAFEEAGLMELAPAFLGDYFPGATPQALAQKDDLCEGAESFVHSHFFTDTGEFGSLTEELEQVDDGTYEITDEGTFVISKEFPDVTFHFEVEGDNLTMTPVLTEELKQEALTHPLDFTAAGWALTMSYPGQVWKRVDCSGWC